MTAAWVKSRLPQPTPVFDSFWYLAAERQRIFLARLRSAPDPLTPDPILRTFKFTNAYRASDRTSQFLIRHVIYDAPRGWRDTFLRVVLFKLFNRIETWREICSQLGEINSSTLDIDRIIAVLDEMKRRGDRIYSAAYIMPSAGAFGSNRKHENHLRLLASMLRDDADQDIARAGSMRDAFLTLISYPSIGPFLAYQLVTDLNYSDHLSFREDEFVVPGPGAVDGLMKCFSDPGDLESPDIIRWVMETQADQLSERGVEFLDLWGRDLQLIDCQNLFCEVDKYARVMHPQFAGRTGRTRIKQRFRRKSEPLTAWYPPKWAINDRVASWLERGASEQVAEPSHDMRLPLESLGGHRHDPTDSVNTDVGI